MQGFRARPTGAQFQDCQRQTSSLARSWGSRRGADAPVTAVESVPEGMSAPAGKDRAPASASEFFNNSPVAPRALIPDSPRRFHAVAHGPCCPASSPLLQSLASVTWAPFPSPCTTAFFPGVSVSQRELGGQGRVLGVGRGNDLRPRGSSKHLRADNTSLSSLTPSVS